MQELAERVVVGMDPHKRSPTIEVMTADETVVGHGRFGTDAAGLCRDGALCEAVAGPGLGG
jgi:transposase